MEIVLRHLFKVKLNRFADQGHVLEKRHVAETLLESSFADIHSYGTTRDHNRVVGHQISADGGQFLSCCFTPVCCEDTDTLVDIAFNLLQELADTHPEEDIEEVLKTMLKHITGLMSNRASVMKSLHISFSQQRREALTGDSLDWVQHQKRSWKNGRRKELINLAN